VSMVWPPSVRSSRADPGLDPARSEELLGRGARLRAEGTTVSLPTQYMEEACTAPATEVTVPTKGGGRRGHRRRAQSPRLGQTSELLANDNGGGTSRQGVIDRAGSARARPA